MTTVPAAETVDGSCIVGCGRERAVGDWCLRCEGMLRRRMVGVRPLAPVDGGLSARIDAALAAMYRYRTNKARFKRLVEHLADDSDTRWARREERGESVLEQLMMLDEESAYSLVSRMVAEYPRLTRAEKMQLLERGFPLPGGHWMSVGSSSIRMDGVQISAYGPWRSLMMAMTASRAAWDEWASVDLKRLFRAIGAATNPVRHFEDAVTSVRYHPTVHRVAGWLSCALLEQMGESHLHGRIRFLRLNRLSVFRHVGRLDEAERRAAPWLGRLERESDGFESLEPARGDFPETLAVRGGRLRLVVEENGADRSIILPADPDLWAMLANCALSPPDSPPQTILTAIRYGWTDGDWLDERIRPEDRRAAKLLWSTIDSLGDVDYDPELRALIVPATSGAVYSVSSRPGVHGAKYRVHAASDIDQLRESHGSPICLHDASNQNRFPFADRLLRVVLTVRDDVRASEKLEPLRKVVRELRHSEHAVPNLVWDRRTRRRWRIELGRRAHEVPARHRWTALLPFVYETLTASAIGDELQMPMAVGGEFRVGDRAAPLRLIADDEIRLVRGLATACGWVSDGVAAAAPQAAIEPDTRPDRDDAGRVAGDGPNGQAADEPDGALAGEVERWVKRQDGQVERATLYDILEPFQQVHGGGQALPWWMIYEDAAVGRGPMHHLMPRALIQNLGLDPDADDDADDEFDDDAADGGAGEAGDAADDDAAEQPPADPVGAVFERALNIGFQNPNRQPAAAAGEDELRQGLLDHLGAIEARRRALQRAERRLAAELGRDGDVGGGDDDCDDDDGGDDDDDAARPMIVVA